MPTEHIYASIDDARLHKPKFTYKITRARIGYRISLKVNDRGPYASAWVPTLQAAHHMREGLLGPWA